MARSRPINFPVVAVILLFALSVTSIWQSSFQVKQYSGKYSSVDSLFTSSETYSTYMSSWFAGSTQEDSKDLRIDDDDEYTNADEYVDNDSGSSTSTTMDEKQSSGKSNRNWMIDTVPRVVYLEEEATWRHGEIGGPRLLEDSLKSSNSSISESLPKVYRAFEQEWFTDCEPVRQVVVRNNCNLFHEENAIYSADVSLLSMSGNWRSVWKMDLMPQNHNSTSSLILKLLHTHRSFDEEATYGHALDSMVMEQLTASPRVVRSFGFCGQSVLTEFALASGSQVMKDSSLSFSHRLRMARDLTRGLAELHALQPIDFDSYKVKDYSNIPAWTNSSNSSIFEDLLQSILSSNPIPPPIFSHHDINSANVVSLHPKQVHWNDFNIGLLSKQHKDKSKSSCQVPIRYGGTLWRSPEEIQNATGRIPQMQPADVYSFGNLLYKVLTKHQPWTHLEEDPTNVGEVATVMKKLNGSLPFLPKKYRSNRLEAKILWEATKACFRRDPKERPTAFQLSISLGFVYDWIRKFHSKDLPHEEVRSLFRFKG